MRSRCYRHYDPEMQDNIQHIADVVLSDVDGITENIEIITKTIYISEEALTDVV